LNEVIRDRKYNVDLVDDKNEYPGDLKNEGAAIFDLLCTIKQGEKFLIEVQRGRLGNFKDWALFYPSRQLQLLSVFTDFSDFRTFFSKYLPRFALLRC